MDNNNNQFNNGGNGNGGGPGSGPGQDPKKQNILLMIMTGLITLLVVSWFMSSLNGNTELEVSYTQFINWVDADKVASVEETSDRINITLKEDSNKAQSGANSTVSNFYSQLGIGSTTYYTAIVEDDTLTQRLLDHNVEIKGRLTSSSDIILSFLFTWVIPLVLMWALLSFLFRKMSKGGGLGMGVGKSNAKVYVQKETGITFRDVAGEDEAKESLVEVVDFLHNPGKYSQIGAKLPKGVLLVGPPGTGKTLLAKAVAGEAKVPFFSLSGSDFIELYVGVGASRVRDLFKEAEKNAPCIVFIDEIDAIGRSRDSKYGGGNEEREQTLNQLLSEMDGFDGKKGIIILAATNRPEILDKALLRPGRFDRRVIVDKPDIKGREEILKVHAKDVMMDETVDLKEIALATSGAVGSDLANMINEGAINAVKYGRNFVSQKDLFEAVEQVLVGKEKKDRLMSAQERRMVSYHEIGHALVSAIQKNSEPVQKITIVPRTMGALGYVMYVPEEEKYLETEAELRDQLVSLVAGRAAEELFFDSISSGAANDIEKATNIARNMIMRFGMSKKFGMMGMISVESQYLDGRTSITCSDVTAAEVDAEIIKLLKDSYKKAKAILKDNKDIMDKLAAHLIEKETITGKEFMKIYRKEKGIPEPVEEEKPKTEKIPAPQQMQTSAQGMPNQPNAYRPQPNPYQNGQFRGQNQYQNNPMNGQNPYQNGQMNNPQMNGQMNNQPGAGNQQTRQQMWDAQYNQNHWSNTQNVNPQMQNRQNMNPQNMNSQMPYNPQNNVQMPYNPQNGNVGRFSGAQQQAGQFSQIQPKEQPINNPSTEDMDIIMKAAAEMEIETTEPEDTSKVSVEEKAAETAEEAVVEKSEIEEPVAEKPIEEKSIEEKSEIEEPVEAESAEEPSERNEEETTEE